MDNFIASLLIERRILLKDTRTIDLSVFCKKRSYELIFGTDESAYNTFVFIRRAKSRMLKAELNTLNELSEKIAASLGIIVNKRILFYNSEICSKVLATSSEKTNKIKWKFYDFM